MCYQCWDEYGKPAHDNAQIRRAVELIEKPYEYSPSGGDLHIALDDWNLGDDSLDSCEGFIAENQFELDADGIAVERDCLTALRALTEEGRASALAIQEGLIA